MPDVKGLINDPEFQKLPMGTQKSTLGQLDPEFSALSDGDFVKFRAGMVKGTPSTLEKVGGYLKSLPNPLTFKPNYGPDVQDVDTGPSYGLMKMAAPGTAAMQGVKGLFAKGAEGAPSAAEAVASKIPKIHPVAKFLAKRIPGVGGALDLLEMFRKEGVDVNNLPKAGRDELAFQLHKETTGKLPETASEKVTAIRNLREALKAPKAPKGATPKAAKAEGVIYDEQGKPFAKKGTAAKGDVPMEDMGTGTPVAPATTPALGAKIGKQYPKQAPPGDMRRQVFAGLKEHGLTSATENKAFQGLVAKTYGKRISAMSDPELDVVMRELPSLVQKLKTGAE